jgi:hypothetical protein
MRSHENNMGVQTKKGRITLVMFLLPYSKGWQGTNFCFIFLLLPIPNEDIEHLV